MTIVPAEADEIEIVRALFREYEAALGIDLCFQNFARELAELPGAYAPPRGRLLLAKEDGAAIGCVALRPIDAGICEMKRLFVRPGHQGRGIGRQLTNAIIAESRTVGYEKLRLDTIPAKMPAANALYLQLGFVPIAPYNEYSITGLLFLELTLRPIAIL